MPHNPFEEVLTPSSGMLSVVPYASGHNHNGFVDNKFMTSEDPLPGCYHVPDGEASSIGADMTSWSEAYNFTIIECTRKLATYILNFYNCMSYI